MGYKCNKCTKILKSKISLSRHKKIHLGPDLLQCQLCSRKFDYKSQFTLHLEVHDQKTYKCKKCDKTFKHMRNLKSHEKLHLNLNVFKCEFCHKNFNAKAFLSRHLLQHTGEKPHKCKQCNKAFTQSSSLKTHEKIHSGLNLFYCDLCPKSFTYKSELKTHIRIHTSQLICNNLEADANSLTIEPRADLSRCGENEISCDQNINPVEDQDIYDYTIDIKEEKLDTQNPRQNLNELNIPSSTLTAEESMNANATGDEIIKEVMRVAMGLLETFMNSFETKLENALKSKFNL